MHKHAKPGFAPPGHARIPFGTRFSAQANAEAREQG
jgi:hypothetical protein